MPDQPEITGEAVCDLCGFPAVRVDGKWQHAEAADAAFCQLVMRGGSD
jgi:hypothetical protein